MEKNNSIFAIWGTGNTTSTSGSTGTANFNKPKEKNEQRNFYQSTGVGVPMTGNNNFTPTMNKQPRPSFPKQDNYQQKTRTFSNQSGANFGECGLTINQVNSTFSMILEF